MHFPFPGWPGPAMIGNRSLIAPVALPMLPVHPGYPAYPSAPYAPQFQQQQVQQQQVQQQQVQQQQVQQQQRAQPQAEEMSGAAEGESEQTGAQPAETGRQALPTAGQGPFPSFLPITRTPSGHNLLRAGGTAGEMHLPPNIPGMPAMPGPPEGMMTGGPQGGGLFQPIAPVAPYSFDSLVRQLHQQGQR